MAEKKYTQAQAKNRREVSRTVDGKQVTFIRFKGVLRYSEPNPDYREKPEGEDTRTAKQRRRTVWKETATQLEARKGRGAKQTDKNVTDVLHVWRDEMERKASESDEARKSVTDYIADYISLRERISLDGKRVLEQSTALDYRKTAKHLEDGFSTVTMAEVTTKYVKEWERKQLENGVSVHSIRKSHRLLHLVFEHAFNEEEIDANPVARVTPPALPTKEPNSLTQEDMRRVTEKLEAMEPTPVVIASYIALHAGLRCSEVCALKWADIDFEGETITVRKAIGFAKGGCYEKSRTKTGKSRTIDFDSEHMAAMLKRRRSLMMQERDNITTNFEQLYVCGSNRGEEFAKPTTISRRWLELSREWELVGTTGERVNFHALRHSNITAQLESGASVKDVADNAGHASTQMTLNTYASALRKGKRNAAKRGGSFMRPKREAEVYELKTGTDD